MTHAEYSEFAQLSEIADRHILKRKIRESVSRYGIAWRNSENFTEWDEFDHEADAREFGRIVDGQMFERGQIIA